MGYTTCSVTHPHEIHWNIMESSWPHCWPANWDMSSPHHIASWKWFGETWDLWRNGGGLLHFQSDDFGNLFLIFYRYNMTFSENRHTTWLFQKIVISCASASLHFTATSADVTTFVLQNSALSEFLPKNPKRYAWRCESNCDVGASDGLTWFFLAKFDCSDLDLDLDLFPSCWSFFPAKLTWVCLKIGNTPKPNGFADHYPVFKLLFHWEYTLFSDKLTLSHWGQSFLAIGPNSSASLLALEGPKTRPQRGSIEKATWFSESSLVKSGHPFGQLWNFVQSGFSFTRSASKNKTYKREPKPSVTCCFKKNDLCPSFWWDSRSLTLSI